MEQNQQSPEQRQIELIELLGRLREEEMKLSDSKNDPLVAPMVQDINQRLFSVRQEILSVSSDINGLISRLENSGRKDLADTLRADFNHAE